MNFSRHRYLILTEGQTHPTPAKLATGIIRYRPERVKALLDSRQAGKDAYSCLKVGRNIPIVESIEKGLAYNPNALLIGITPPGGKMPSAWRQIVIEAIGSGLDIVAGMHTLLKDDREFVSLAATHHVELIDLREIPKGIGVNTCRAQTLNCFRIHTVGTDCNIGKKVTALEINKQLEQMGKRSVFLATGQTGIVISGKGIAMDHVVSDFVAGAAESLVLENQKYDYLVIEGQGALTHPLYSGVTLSMLHGFAPQALILCHQVDRTIMRGSVDTPVLSVEKMIDLYERIARPVFPSRVVGLALNCFHIKDENRVREMIAEMESRTGLPATDVIRIGAEKLVNAVLNFQKSRFGIKKDSNYDPID